MTPERRIDGLDESSSRAEHDDWNTHWDSFGEAAARNPANRYRLRLVLAELEKEPRSVNVLDLGSGQGELTLAIAGLHQEFNLRGLEYSISGVERARAAARRRRIPAQFEQRDLLVDSASNDELAWADAAVCSEVLEHLDDPAKFLRNALVYIRPGGKVVVTVPAGPRSALDRHIGHRRHYSPRSLRSLLTSVGFQHISIARAGFPFFNLYRLSVIARGRALIADIDSSYQGQFNRRRQTVVRLATAFFERAFSFTLDDSPFGWQLVASATAPD